VRVNDRLLTSGIDRVYPAGIPVARVTRVTHSQSGPYLQVACVPLAGLDRSRAVLVLRADPPTIQTPLPLPPKDNKP
ncbi:MAG: rod shape-determining protein MreC, partial [Gammaproteobacteria bacterium]|nr:rod shape-determining protein MreC [Gammaproteobacteria bacterium]